MRLTDILSLLEATITPIAFLVVIAIIIKKNSKYSYGRIILVMILIILALLLIGFGTCLLLISSSH